MSWNTQRWGQSYRLDEIGAIAGRSKFCDLPGAQQVLPITKISHLGELTQDLKAEV